MMSVIDCNQTKQQRNKC